MNIPRQKYGTNRVVVTYHQMVRHLVHSPPIRRRQQHTVVYAVGEGWTGALGTGRIGEMILGHGDDDNYGGGGMAPPQPTNVEGDGDGRNTTSWWRTFANKPSSKPVVVYDTSSSPTGDTGDSENVTSKRLVSCAVGWGHTALIVEESTTTLNLSSSPPSTPPQQQQQTTTIHTQLLVTGRPHDFVSLLKVQRLPRTIRNYMAYHTYDTIRRANILDRQSNMPDGTKEYLPVSFNPIHLLGQVITTLTKAFGNPKKDPDWGAARDQSFLIVPTPLPLPFDTTTTTINSTASNTPAITSTTSNTPAITSTTSNTPAITSITSNTPAITSITSTSSNTPAITSTTSNTPATTSTTSNTPATTSTTSNTPAITSTTSNTPAITSITSNTPAISSNTPASTTTSDTADSLLLWTDDPATPAPNDVPIQVAGAAGLTAVTTAHGHVYTFGLNGMGQCGIGDASNNVWTPSRVTGLSREFSGTGYRATTLPQSYPIAQVCLGLQHGLCLNVVGELYSWGKGDRGQLGNDAVESESHTAVPITKAVIMNDDYTSKIEYHALQPISQISSGMIHSAAYEPYTNSVYVWGKHILPLVTDETIATGPRGKKTFFQRLAANVRIASDARIPVCVNGLPTHLEVLQIACGSHHTAMLLEDGSVWCVGLCADTKRPQHHPICTVEAGMIDLSTLTQFAAHMDRTTIVFDGQVLQVHLWENPEYQKNALFTPAWVDELQLHYPTARIREVHRSWLHTAIVADHE